MTTCLGTKRIHQFLLTGGPACLPIYNLITGATAARLESLVADNPTYPEAVYARSYFSYLFGSSQEAVLRLVSFVLKTEKRIESCMVPAGLADSLRSVAGFNEQNTVRMYLWQRLPETDSLRIEALGPDDTAVLVKNAPYPVDDAYIRGRIIDGPTRAIRNHGELTAWAMVHDCGAMGLLRVLDSSPPEHGRGTAVVKGLINLVAARAIRPFGLVEPDNAAMLRICGKTKATAAGDFVWFGAGEARERSSVPDGAVKMRRTESGSKTEV